MLAIAKCACKKQEVPTKVFTSLAAITAIAISLKINLAEVLFWGCGAAAYLPAFSAWTSACILWEIGSDRHREEQTILARLSLCQLGLTCLFWEGSLIPLLTLPTISYLFALRHGSRQAKTLGRTVISQYLFELIIVAAYSTPALINMGKLRILGASELGPSSSIATNLGHIQAKIYILSLLLATLRNRQVLPL